MFVPERDGVFFSYRFICIKTVVRNMIVSLITHLSYTQIFLEKTKNNSYWKNILWRKRKTKKFFNYLRFKLAKDWNGFHVTLHTLHWRCCPSSPDENTRFLCNMTLKSNEIFQILHVQKSMIENNSTWEGVFYQSDRAKIISNWVILVFPLYVCCC